MELLTESTVQEVVRVATKRQVEVEKYSSKPFAANFCLMRSLEVHIKKDGEASVLNFLAKHTSDGSDIFTSYRHRAFAKEIFFYGTLAPLLNEELKKAGMEPLSIPRCFYAASSADSALLVMEDLRSRGFRASRFLIDEAHGLLLAKEVAKLHAASLMLRDRGDEPLTERFPYLLESWTLGPEHRSPFQTYTSMGTRTMAEMFCTGPELQELRGWLERVAPDSLLLIMKQLEHMPHTSVITHGDLHTRNCLFRYDDAGRPVEVVLLDLQVIRVASPVADLSYMLHLCVLPSTRDVIIPAVLKAYHDTLQAALAGSDTALPISKEQLDKEMKESRLGVLYAILMLAVACKVINTSEMKGEKKSEAGIENIEEHAEENEVDAGKEEKKLNTNHIAEIKQVLTETAVYASNLGVHKQFADIDNHLWKE